MDESRARQEIDAMNQKADFLTDESVEATRRMKALVDESANIGGETLVRLHEQGEQLDNIEGHLETMDNDLKQAERDLNQLEKCCGMCICCCGNKGNKFVKSQGDLHAVAYGEKDGGGGKSDVVTTQPGNSARGNAAGGQMVQRVLNDDRETEMDQNLNDVSTMLGNLKNMAMDMGSELERQNDQIDRINTKADSNDVRLGMANEQAKRIAAK